MRKLLIGALVAGQVLGSGAPAFAQGFAPAQETQAGAFAGLRVHLSFGSATPEPLRAGLAFAPTVRTSTQDGRVRTRIAEGGGFRLTDYPAVEAWLKRVEADPGHVPMEWLG